MSDEPRRPSDTLEIDRRALLEAMLEQGTVVFCPTCGGDGIVAPRVADRARLAVPPAPRDRETVPEILAAPKPDDPDRCGG